MKYIKYITNVYLIMIIILISISNFSCSQVKFNSNQKQDDNIIYDEKEINMFVESIIKSIKEENINYLVNILYDDEIEYDYYKFKNKKEVVNDLNNKKRIYAYLFDVKLKSLVEEIEPGLIPEEMSIKDIINKSKNIKIKKIEIIDSKRKLLRCHLTNDLEIGSNQKESNYDILGLNKVDVIIKDGKYYLYSLIFDYMPTAY